MYRLIRPLLFALPEETAHAFCLQALHFMPAFFFPTTPEKPIHAMGLHFQHPVGIAAGFDKNAQYLDALAKLGFSFIEVGTVTPKAQVGNPKPRLFRLPKADALINRMGFNNAGVDALVANIRASQYRGILGVNIGKNKETALERAVDDYVICLQAVYPYASYVTLNISSPNTPDLRQLQQAAYLENLVSHVCETAMALVDQYQRHVPLLIKVSPDEDEDTLRRIVDIALSHQIAGMIITNTTLSREGVDHLPHASETGGLSGKPLFSKSLACLQMVKSQAGEAMTLIASGGIDSPETAQAKLKAGANLVQLYTGLVYQGPGLVREIVKMCASL